ncbi:DUF859 family phage minor structural protein [Anaerofustis stercorihominis]|uniref:DUF859 family phage minor structural protein n=1 Tax=Anaerofustis stercorihominis TaxID=214853 RepID=UPI0011063C72|nr:DUF859 family phage minor structural protein [Anaerofustis stercorihominis]
MATIKGNYASSSYDLYVTCSTNSQSVTNNSSSVTFTFGMYKASANSQSYNLNSQTFTYKINGVKYTKSVSFDFRSKGTGTYNKLFSVTKTIAHNADGTKTVSVSASHPTGISLGTGSLSGSYKLATIPRASTPTLSASSVNVGSSVTIYTNRKSSSFTHKIVCAMGSYSKTISNVGSSTSLSLDTSLADYITSATSATMKITCTTYNGSTNIGSKYVNLTVKVPNTDTFKPTVSSNEITGNSTLEGLLVQNVSTIDSLITAVGKNNSTIKTYKVNVGGKAYSSTSSHIKGIALPSSGEGIKILTSVVDSRGYESTALNSTIAVYPYSNLNISNFNVKRAEESSGNSLIVSFNADFASVGNKNKINYILYSKTPNEEKDIEFFKGEVSIGDSNKDNGIVEGVQKNVVVDSSNSVININIPKEYGDFSPNKTFIIRAIFNDFASSMEVPFILKTEFVTVDLKSGGKGVAIGKSSEVEDNFDVGLATTYLSNNVYMGGDKRTANVRYLHFNNADIAQNKHHMALYGGNGDSNTGFGIKDAIEDVSVMYYDDQNKKFVFNKPIFYGSKELTTSITALFKGSITSGQKTGVITGLTRYRLYMIVLKDYGTAILGIRKGSYLRGIGGYASDSPSSVTYHFGSTISESGSGHIINVVYARSTGHNASSHAYVNNIVISEIYGVI